MLFGILHVGLLPSVWKSWQIQIMLHVIMWRLSCSTEFHSQAILHTVCFQLVPYRNIHLWLANTLWSCMQSFFLPPKCHHPSLLHVHIFGSPLMNIQIPFSLSFWNYFQQITSGSFASFKCNLPQQTKKKNQCTSSSDYILQKHYDTFQAPRASILQILAWLQWKVWLVLSVIFTTDDKAHWLQMEVDKNVHPFHHVCNWDACKGNFWTLTAKAQCNSNHFGSADTGNVLGQKFPMQYYPEWAWAM